MADEIGARAIPLPETQSSRVDSGLGNAQPEKPSSSVAKALAEDLTKQLDAETGLDADTVMRNLAEPSGGVKAFGKPKSPETIKAQLATFAAEGIEDFKGKGHILNHLDSIVSNDATEVTRVTESPEYHKEANGEVIRVPEDTEKTVANRADYVSFLRSVGGSRYEGVQVRSEILKAYSEFAPEVERLRIELSDPETRKKNPAFLGSGSNSMVFSISKDNKVYAVRVPNGEATDPSVIDSHLAGAVLGKGVAHMEQIVAASYEDGVTVAEIMPGKEMGNLTVEEIGQITDRQLGEFVDTLITVRERGIEIDPKPSNIFYDPESGFGIVDYHSSRIAGKTSADQELGQIVGWIATSIDNAGLYGKKSKDIKSAEYYAHDLEFMQTSLGVLKRFRGIVGEKLQGEDRQTALKRINERIESDQAQVENYSNPQWVAEQIAYHTEQAAARANSPKSGWGEIVS